MLKLILITRDPWYAVDTPLNVNDPELYRTGLIILEAAYIASQYCGIQAWIEAGEARLLKGDTRAADARLDKAHFRQALLKTIIGKIKKGQNEEARPSY